MNSYSWLWCCLWLRCTTHSFKYHRKIHSPKGTHVLPSWPDYNRYGKNLMSSKHETYFVYKKSYYCCSKDPSQFSEYFNYYHFVGNLLSPISEIFIKIPKIYHCRYNMHFALQFKVKYHVLANEYNYWWSYIFFFLRKINFKRKRM